MKGEKGRISKRLYNVRSLKKTAAEKTIKQTREHHQKGKKKSTLLEGYYMYHKAGQEIQQTSCSENSPLSESVSQQRFQLGLLRELLDKGDHDLHCYTLQLQLLELQLTASSLSCVWRIDIILVVGNF